MSVLRFVLCAHTLPVQLLCGQQHVLPGRGGGGVGEQEFPKRAQDSLGPCVKGDSPIPSPLSNDP